MKRFHRRSKPLAAIRLIAVLLAGLLLPANRAAAEQGPHIVFFGDSLTAGYGLNPGEGYAELLTQMLAEKGLVIKLTNAGASGDTTSGGLARLDWSVPEDADGVVLALGANDALRGIPVAQTRENLEAMVLRFKEREISILLAGMLSPPSMGREYETAFNAIYPELAKKHALSLYPFLLDGVAANPSLNQQDGIHPNSDGMKIIAERMMPSFEVFAKEVAAAN